MPASPLQLLLIVSAGSSVAVVRECVGLVEGWEPDVGDADDGAWLGVALELGVPAALGVAAQDAGALSGIVWPTFVPVAEITAQVAVDAVITVASQMAAIRSRRRRFTSSMVSSAANRCRWSSFAP